MFRVIQRRRGGTTNVTDRIPKKGGNYLSIEMLRKISQTGVKTGGIAKRESRKSNGIVARNNEKEGP